METPDHPNARFSVPAFWWQALPWNKRSLLQGALSIIYSTFLFTLCIVTNAKMRITVVIYSMSKDSIGNIL